MVMKDSDIACYAAKEAGRNRVHMVAGEKDSARIHRGQVRWVQRLREAMDKGSKEDPKIQARMKDVESAMKAIRKDLIEVVQVTSETPQQTKK